MIFCQIVFREMELQKEWNGKEPVPLSRIKEVYRNIHNLKKGKNTFEKRKFVFFFLENCVSSGALFNLQMCVYEYCAAHTICLRFPNGHLIGIARSSSNCPCSPTTSQYYVFVKNDGQPERELDERYRVYLLYYIHAKEFAPDGTISK